MLIPINTSVLVVNGEKIIALGLNPVWFSPNSSVTAYTTATEVVDRATPWRLAKKEPSFFMIRQSLIAGFWSVGATHRNGGLIKRPSRRSAFKTALLVRLAKLNARDMLYIVAFVELIEFGDGNLENGN
jgi:hypothetical protein